MTTNSCSSSSSDSFHAQLAAVIEVLANKAVAEICKLVDDGYAMLRLEITQNQREMDSLRRKLLDAKFQTAKRNHTLERLSTLKHSGSMHVSRGPSAPSRARCNPATKSSTQGTGGEEEDGGHGFPIILSVESGDGSTLKDIQPTVNQGSDTNTRASASTLSSRPIAVEPENHLHRAQRSNTRHHSNGRINRDQPSSDRNNRFTNTTGHNDGNLFASASKWAEAGAGPHQEGRTGSNTDGREGSSGAPEHGGRDVSGDPSNVAPSLAGNLDWEPDMVVVDSVPIKVEADMSSGWSIIGDGTTRSVKQRLQKDRRKEELEAARSAPTPSTETLDGTKAFQSGFVDTNSATSYGDLSSFPSLLSAIKTPRQVLHPQANRGGDGQSSPLSDVAASSSSASRLLSSMALPAQRARDAGGQPLRCELCGKTFSKFQNLRLHQRMHAGEKLFRCPVCGKSFLQSNHLQRHLSVHS